MNTKTTSQLIELEADKVSNLLNTNNYQLIDVRETSEFNFERIPGATSAPVSTIDRSSLKQEECDKIILYCAGGLRSKKAAEKLLSLGWPKVSHLKGGIQAWKAQGLATEKTSEILPIMRQVQIAAGSLILLGLSLSYLVHPLFIGITTFVGCGLLFAGISGWCGMAKLLGKMPWNK